MVERISVDKVRFFRVERTYAVKTGKWYFEFEAVTGGDMRVGWARPGCKPDVELGTDELAFVFDGYRVSYIHLQICAFFDSMWCNIVEIRVIFFILLSHLLAFFLYLNT